MAIYTSITDLIGGTPLLELKNYEAENKLEARLMMQRLRVFLSRGLLLLSLPAATPVSVWHP